MKGLRPMMSVTEYIMVMSLVPTQGADVSRRHGRDHDLGKAVGQLAHDRGGERRALRAAERDERVHFASRDKVANDLGRAGRHDRPGLLAVGSLAQGVERRAAGAATSLLEMSARVAGSPIKPVSMTSARCPRAST